MTVLRILASVAPLRVGQVIDVEEPTATALLTLGFAVVEGGDPQPKVEVQPEVETSLPAPGDDDMVELDG